MTKSTALYKILEFGRKEERELIKAAKTHEAYQIEHARRTLLYALIRSIKDMKDTLYYMVNYDEKRLLAYVNDNVTRSLLVDLACELNIKL